MRAVQKSAGYPVGVMAVDLPWETDEPVFVSGHDHFADAHEEFRPFEFPQGGFEHNQMGVYPRRFSALPTF